MKKKPGVKRSKKSNMSKPIVKKKRKDQQNTCFSNLTTCHSTWADLSNNLVDFHETKPRTR